MRTRMVWAVGLFAGATLVTARVGEWLHEPLIGPLGAVVMALVGAALIGLAPAPPRTAAEQRLSGEVRAILEKGEPG